MSESLNIGLTNDQRDLLLQGLRFVRSSVLLEIHDPTPEIVETREGQLHEIETLVEQLSGSRSADTPARR